MRKVSKADVIIDKALERYKPDAAAKVQQGLCAVCPDRRCERGEPCNTYALLVKASAWALASWENN